VRGEQVIGRGSGTGPLSHNGNNDLPLAHSVVPAAHPALKNGFAFCTFSSERDAEDAVRGESPVERAARAQAPRRRRSRPRLCAVNPLLAVRAAMDAREFLGRRLRVELARVKK
jgi:hypothetical protein